MKTHEPGLIWLQRIFAAFALCLIKFGAFYIQIKIVGVHFQEFLSNWEMSCQRRDTLVAQLLTKLSSFPTDWLSFTQVDHNFGIPRQSSQFCTPVELTWQLNCPPLPSHTQMLKFSLRLNCLLSCPARFNALSFWSFSRNINCPYCAFLLFNAEYFFLVFGFSRHASIQTALYRQPALILSTLPALKLCQSSWPDCVCCCASFVARCWRWCQLVWRFAEFTGVMWYTFNRRLAIHT